MYNVNLPVFSPELAETQGHSEAEAQLTDHEAAHPTEADRATSDADGRPLHADRDIIAASPAGDGEEKDRHSGSLCVLPPERDDQPDQSAILLD